MLSFGNFIKANEVNQELHRQIAGNESDEEEEEEDESAEVPILVIDTPSHTIEVPSMKKVNQNNQEDKSYHYLQSNESIQNDVEKMKEDIEWIRDLSDQINRRTITDWVQDQISLKLFQVTFVIFTFVYVIVKSFGETQYILLNLAVYLIIWTLLSEIILEETIFVANDFHSGWNYYLKMVNTVVIQIFFLVTLALIFEEIKVNTSIHPMDSVRILIINLVQWMTFLFFIMILVHYVQQFWFFIHFLIRKKNTL